MRSRNVIFRILSIAAFVLLEIAAVCLIRKNGEIQDRWFAKGGQAVRAFVWGTTEKWSDYFSLGAVNDSLAVRNVELAERLAHYTYLLENNREASVASSLPDVHKRYTFIPAKVIKISNNTQHNHLIIDKGSEDGVEVGDGIITTKGVAGIVESVSRHYSCAISLKNYNVNISARLGTDGPVGSLKWDGKTGDNAVLSEIPQHITLNKLDTVYTSGFSFIFPENIPLGTTAEAKVKGGATYDIKVKLFEDFSRLRYVAVVKDHDKKEISGLEDATK